MKSLKSNKGFTLIELVVVIAILGILAGIAIPRFLDATATARGAKIVADLRTIDSAVMMYNAKTGKMPTAIADITTDAATAATPQYKLLASWPKPPTGTAYINNTSNVQQDISASVTDYTLGTTSTTVATYGRGLYNGKTVDDLLATGVTTKS